MSGAGAVEVDRTPGNPEGLRDMPFEVPRATAAQRRRGRAVADALAERYPGAGCALVWRRPHELLVATILSAQATDAGVNRATPALFARFPEPADYARAGEGEIEGLIRSIGLFRMKARAVREAMRAVAQEHGGEVPRTMEGLLAFRGVARKTANVVLGNAFGVEAGFVVDTHIGRLAKRFGLAPTDASAAAVERWLCAVMPRGRWCELSHQMIAHGRAVCRARGALCGEDAICQRFCSNAKGALR